MFKKIFLTVFIFTNSIMYSQKTVGYISMELKSNRDFFQIANEETKETTLFASDRKKVQVVLLNDKMEVKDTLSAIRPERKYKDIIGFSGAKSSPRLYWSNPEKDEIFCQFYDFKNKKVSNLDYKLDLGDERFLQLFSENSKFYLLTLVKNSEFLKLYVFDSEGKLETKSINFSTIKITDTEGKTKDIEKVLKQNSSFERSKSAFISPFNAFKKTFEIKKITYESPTSLTDTSQKLKCYTLDNKIIITFDENDTVTQFLSIDLTTYEPAIKIFDKPYINNSENETIKTNSFLYDNKLFQVATTSYQMKMVIKDLNNNVLKEFTANESEPIDFKNSAMIRISPTGSERILDKTEQFLNKISNFDFGVSCYNLNGIYTITIGSVSEIRSNGGGGFGIGFGGGMSGGSFGMNGGMPAYNFGTFNTFGYNYFSYTGNNFDSYASRKVIYINCLLDSKLNHQKGEIKQIAFDKIKEYIRDQDFQSSTLFKLANNYYLGYYEKDVKQFRIIEFNE